MTGSPGGQRVLVVDDVEEMRTVIRRALSASGYEVDVASTVTEARGMDPAGYDAVLVDANLGAERGIDLVEALRSADPTAAARCLVITGGSVDMLPDGVACLAKPFRMGELLEAVRKLHQPDTLTAPDGRAGIRTDSGAPRPAPGPAGRRQPVADEPRTWQLLGVTRQIRERERHELADFLHDGPIQDLTAATLELQMLRRSASSGQVAHFGAVQQRLDSAAGSLRWLVDGHWPFLRPETQLAAALQQRTAWLLAAPVTVGADELPPGLCAIEVLIIVDVVELMLLGMVPAGLPARARVAVRAGERLIQIELTITSAAEHDHAIGDPATAKASLDRLASALRASAHNEFLDQIWRARIDLQRAGAAVPQQ